MIEIVNKINCSGCNACFNICPKNAIDMQEDNEGFKYPVINKEKCTNCGLCEKICPIFNNKNNVENIKKPNVIAAYSNDNLSREHSSSGGVFTELAKYILNQNGIVFGVGYDNNLNVIHKEVNNITELEGLKRIKICTK